MLEAHPARLGVNPGQIDEGRFTVEGGAVVLKDRDGTRIASLPLQPGQDPTAERGSCCGRPGKQQTSIARCAIPIWALRDMSRPSCQSMEPAAVASALR